MHSSPVSNSRRMSQTTPHADVFESYSPSYNEPCPFSHADMQGQKVRRKKEMERRAMLNRGMVDVVGCRRDERLTDVMQLAGKIWGVCVSNVYLSDLPF